jgi:integrase
MWGNESWVLVMVQPDLFGELGPVVSGEICAPAPSNSQPWELAAPAAPVLTPETLDYIVRSKADDTRRAYAHSVEDYLGWCRQERRTPVVADPVTMKTLMAEYTRACVERHWSPAYITRHWSAIRGWCAAQGFPRPDLGFARMVLHTWERELAEAKWKPKQAPVYTVEDVRAMAACRPGDTFRDLRDRTVLILCVAAYARRSEPTYLDFDDVTFVAQGMILDFRKTKTGPKDKVIPYGAYLLTCPVRTVQAYMAALATFGITSGPLLRACSWAGRPNRWRLTGQSVNNIQRTLAVEAGIRNGHKVTGHSARASGATISYEAGKPLHAIADHGGWKPGSDSLYRYLRLTDRWEQSPVAGIGL